ncbi:hypothetical protein B7P43_G12251 [Cryptotermes secundus]|uniref:MRH domain-containing protein n=2 Tax=Cryptotermes secundus TaxID=105785 RepID=A0A2J7QHM2_9NEOP|nr:cation-independent mannose-6-phosphate receptor isoform X1 [Cryptotermes secundus]XP_033608587.1 cation-independent mannose-6-phosphate receptor isoform X1 [Cryptotermes secundus]PNF28080.1 hypothetical protein B7P43_G12251 [Cryptotermes secundus]PNF28081.1 hypothetical protein B7P43_G12251 [Cryptotermes secundus]
MTTNKVVEMILFLLLTVLMFIISSGQKLSNCEFNVTYSGQPVIYNLTRLSRQESWQTADGENRASIFVCHTPSQCQNSSVCVLRQQDKMWNVVISNYGANWKTAQPKINRPVLELVGTQPCYGGRNYSAEIYFNCSSAERDPVLMGVRDSCTLLVMWQTVAACPVDKGCVFGDIDFSSLRHSDYYEVVADTGQKYLLNLCGPVRLDACGNIEHVTACEVGKNNSVTVIGQLDGHHVQMSESTGIALHYKASSKGPRTEIQFICNASAANNSPKFVRFSKKTYIFKVGTPLACKAWPQECVVLDSNGGLIDLSPLRKNNDNWVTQPLSSGVQYHINVCGPLNPMRTHNCSVGVGACMTNSSSSVNMGYITSGPRVTASNTVILEYTGGSPCAGERMHSMQIKFLCSKVDGVPVFVKETASCVHYLFWETPVACPSLVAAGQNCLVRDKQYGNMFNLMVLHSPRGGYHLTTEEGNMYLINVCGPLNKTCNGQEASVCLTTHDHRSFAIGYVNKTVLYDNGGLRFVLHGEGCNSERNSSTVTIILLCRQGSDLGEPEMFSRDEECNFYYIWNTVAACPPYRSADCHVTHNGQYYDLSQLSDSMSNHIVLQPQLNLRFLLNVCQSVVFGKYASCEYTAAACLVNLSIPDPTRSFTNIGDVGDGPYFENDKLKLKYNGGDICLNQEGPDHISTVITFECDNSTDHMPELLPGDVCVYEFLWRTPAACPVNVKSERPQEDDSCTVAIPGRDNRVNLRPLRNKIKMVSDLDGYNYTFVVCGNLSSSHCGNGSVGVCQFQAQNQSQFWSAGVGNSHLHYNEGAISLEYTDGAPCKDGLTRRTRIDFVCEMNGSERVAFIEKLDSCSFLIIWYTDVACSTKVECFTPARSDTAPINLTPLVRLDHNYKVQIRNDTVVYINVCHPLLPVQGLSCAGGSSACVAHLQNGSLTDEKSLGFALGPVKGDKGRAYIMYSQGSVCDSGPNYSSKFEFECDPKSGQGEPEFRELTDDCQYQFIWKTSVTCEPFIKNVSISDGQCVLSNEQINASMNLWTLAQHGVMQVEEYSVNLCSTGTVMRTSDFKLYGTLTSVVFDYQQQQVRLLFTGGAICTSSENYKAQLLLNCDREAGSSGPNVLTLCCHGHIAGKQA